MTRWGAVTLALLGAASASDLNSSLECDFSLELLHLQDFSDSVLDDIPQLKVKLPELLNLVQNEFPGSRFALGTFTDKPVAPFGSPPLPWFDGDWCLSVEARLDPENEAELLVEQMLSRSPGGGGDWRENQLGALLEVAANDTLVGWSGGKFDENGLPIVRVVVLSTDASYHRAPDGNALIDPTKEGCASRDYPTAEEVGAVLAGRGIYTIFLVAGDDQGDLLTEYYWLLESFGTGGGVYSLDSKSETIVEAMIDALSQLKDRECSTPTLDVVFATDVTHSYRNDLPNLYPRLERFMEEISQSYVAPKFGLISFADKPIRPFGSMPSGDYCYRVEAPLTAELGVVVMSAAALSMRSGLDWRESQIDALVSAAADPTLAWRTGSKWHGFPLSRILVITTDSGYHRAGDASDAGLALRPRQPNAVGDCLEEDYPSWQDLAYTLREQNIHPLFVPTSDVASIYRQLLRDMEDVYGVVGVVEPLDDFGDLASVVQLGIAELQDKLQGVKPPSEV